MHCTNAFGILSVHEVGYQTADQSGLMICARLSRLHIPAGILRIPVFSVPVAFFFTGITIPVPP
jgi:hypothetical protein